MVIATPFGDRYQVLEAIPAEAPVAAFRATTAEGVPVVIKAAKAHDVEAALATAEAARAVEDTHVVRVLEAGALEDVCFFVYEAFDGRDLRAVLDDAGKVPAQTAAGWGAQAAAGLAAIHAAGLVHGRVRPSALVLAGDMVKVADLGLCDALGPADLTVTAPAETGYYVSPEEVLARPLEPASDTYALGTVLFELATGKAPIGGPDAFTVAQRHAEGLVRPPRDLDPAIPVEFQNAVLTSLSKAPGDRYSSARRMQRDLERVVAGAPVAPPRTNVAAGGRPHPVLPWAIVAGVITIVATLLVLWLAGIIGGGVAVPDVTGLPVAEATERLEDAGLSVGELTYDAGDFTATQDTVLSQDPVSGTEVDEGTSVDLVLAGTAPATVPDVTGMDQATATSALLSAGFTLGQVVQAPDAEAPAGSVIGQSPSAGTQAAAGTAVTLTVSTGPPPGAYTPTPTPTVLTPTPTATTPTPTVLTPTPDASGSPDVLLP